MKLLLSIMAVHGCGVNSLYLLLDLSFASYKQRKEDVRFVVVIDKLWLPINSARVEAAQLDLHYPETM